MNLKKYLKERAEKDAEALLTDADREFCRQLAERVVEEHRQKEAEKRKKKKRFFF